MRKWFVCYLESMIDRLLVRCSLSGVDPHSLSQKNRFIAWNRSVKSVGLNQGRYEQQCCNFSRAVQQHCFHALFSLRYKWYIVNCWSFYRLVRILEAKSARMLVVIWACAQLSYYSKRESRCSLPRADVSLASQSQTAVQWWRAQAACLLRN